MERARPRPALRPRRALRRADAAGAPRSTACSSGSPRASATSSASPPSSRTSCARRSHACSGETELTLGRTRTPDEYRRALEAIERNVEQMTRTVEALVAAARHEAGLERTTSDARDAVVAVARAHPRRARVDVDVRVALPTERGPGRRRRRPARAHDPAARSTTRRCTAARVELELTRNWRRRRSHGHGRRAGRRRTTSATRIFEPGSAGVGGASPTTAAQDSACRSRGGLPAVPAATSSPSRARPEGDSSSLFRSPRDDLGRPPALFRCC